MVTRKAAQEAAAQKKRAEAAAAAKVAAAKAAAAQKKMEEAAKKAAIQKKTLGRQLAHTINHHGHVCAKPGPRCLELDPQASQSEESRVLARGGGHGGGRAQSVMLHFLDFAFHSSSLKSRVPDPCFPSFKPGASFICHFPIVFVFIS